MRAVVLWRGVDEEREKKGRGPEPERRDAGGEGRRGNGLVIARDARVPHRVQRRHWQWTVTRWGWGGGSGGI